MVLYGLAIWQKFNFYGTLKFLLTQGHIGLEISKRYQFHAISVKVYEDIGYHGGIQAVTGKFLTYALS